VSDTSTGRRSLLLLSSLHSLPPSSHPTTAHHQTPHTSSLLTQTHHTRRWPTQGPPSGFRTYTMHCPLIHYELILIHYALGTWRGTRDGGTAFGSFRRRGGTR
jgi:hypothetical protein